MKEKMLVRLERDRMKAKVQSLEEQVRPHEAPFLRSVQPTVTPPPHPFRSSSSLPSGGRRRSPSGRLPNGPSAVKPSCPSRTQSTPSLTW
jgi:hypothetical protein